MFEYSQKNFMESGFQFSQDSKSVYHSNLYGICNWRRSQDVLQYTEENYRS
jgi:hypothetical protein